MKWILGVAAAALMLATQAGAATIDATIGGLDKVVLGQSNKLTIDTWNVILPDKVISPGKEAIAPNYFEMDLILPTKKITFRGSLFPQNNKFQFDWVFSTSDQTRLDITGELRSFYGVPWVFNGTYGRDPIPVPSNAKEIVSYAFSASREFNLASEQTIAVMPIGGTLPLMLSALGLMGWAAKRRAKRGALSA